MRTLSQQELNRALLARQLLLERSRLPLPRALERVAGIQAQYAPSMYVGLWSRLEGFERAALDRALERRTVVQGTLMRHTIHLVSRADYWPLATAVRSARRERWLRSHRGALDAEQTDPLAAAEHLVRRYLRGFGPASRRDVASFTGLPPSALAPVLERMELRRLRSEDRQELVDLPRAPLPPADTPAPVRFLPAWDATLLAHARRTGVLPEEHRPRLFSTRNPQSSPSFLVDGRVAGLWRYADGRIELDPFDRLDRGTERELREEAERLAVEDVLDMRGGESQADLGRACLQLRCLRPCAGPRSQRGIEPVGGHHQRTHRPRSLVSKLGEHHAPAESAMCRASR